MSPSDSLVEACDRYLQTMKCQLWAHHNIATDDGRRKAAIWLASQVQGVLVEKAVKVTTVHDLGLVGER